MYKKKYKKFSSVPLPFEFSRKCLVPCPLSPVPLPLPLCWYVRNQLGNVCTFCEW